MTHDLVTISIYHNYNTNSNTTNTIPTTESLHTLRQLVERAISSRMVYLSLYRFFPRCDMKSLLLLPDTLCPDSIRIINSNS